MRAITTSMRTRYAFALLTVAWTLPSFALPVDSGGGEGTPAQEHALHCIENAMVSFGANPAQVPLGAGSTLNWSVHFPSGCSGLPSGEFAAHSLYAY